MRCSGSLRAPSGVLAAALCLVAGPALAQIRRPVTPPATVPRPPGIRVPGVQVPTASPTSRSVASPTLTSVPPSRTATVTPAPMPATPTPTRTPVPSTATPTAPAPTATPTPFLSSREAFTPPYGAGQFPLLAVDPKGRWVAQAGRCRPGAASSPLLSTLCRLNVFELRSDSVSFVGSHDVPFQARADASYFRIRALAFSADGSALWASVGWQYKPTWFATYLVRFETTRWSHVLYGPIETREYLGDQISAFALNRIQPVLVETSERVVAPVEPSGSVGFDTVLVFDPASPTTLERWHIDARPADAPGFLLRTTDVAGFGGLLAVAGWADGLNQPGEASPRAAVTIVRMVDRAVIAGPYAVPTVAGIADSPNARLSGLRCRWSADGSRLWLAASEAVWPPNGSPNPNRNGIAAVEVASGKTTVAYLPRLQEETEYDIVLDLLESGGVPLLLRLHQSRLTGNRAELVALQPDLRPGPSPLRLCADVGWLVYAEPHPTRPGDVVVSASLPGVHLGVVGLVRPGA